MKPSSRQKGVALVAILSVLLLVTVLVVAFFAATQMETQSAANQEQLNQLHRLREVPLEIVKAQILGATTNGQSGGLASVNKVWASQPGLIRVFNTAGTLDRLYKLYSSAEMEATNTTFLSTEIPDDWPTQTNRFVNLNQPFPSPTQPGESTFPILDPAAVSWAEGLTISADPSGQTNAAMPVEWLYVLKDGSLVPQNQITNPDNPPTARIAFWTDDESCKVNINTAGERTFWDRPRAGHHKNYAFRYNQPSTGEYNAYPGHPATVSLSAVFQNALTGDSQGEIVESMLALTPRYAWGGSKDASIPTYDPRIELDRTKAGSTIKNDRLFPTTAEFLFQPLPSPRSIADSRLEEPLKKSDFLLTASSRSPELNLFGLPRVGLWPIDTDPDKRTVYDRLIARGTTIASQPFYFQRSDPLATNEAEGIPRNWDLLQYLDALTSRPVPGFGGSFATKYGPAGNRQILTQMFDYIRSLTNLCDTSRTEAEFSKQFTPATSTHNGYVLPTRVSSWNTRGFGRLPVVTNVGLVLYAYAQTGYEDSPDDPVTERFSLADDAETDVHMLFWFNFITPSLGVAPLSTTYKIVMKNPNFALGSAGTPEQISFGLRGTTNNRFRFTDQGKDWGGYETMIGAASGRVAPGDPLKNYEFHSLNSVKITGKTMNFFGGDLEFEIRDNLTDELLQTYTVNFPSSTTPWPVPLAWQKTDIPAQTDPAPPTFFWDRNPLSVKDADQAAGTGDLTMGFLLGTRNLYNPTKYRHLDVIRGVELKHGDARIVACLDTIPSSLFQPSKGYFDGNRRIACSLLFTRNVSNVTRVFGSEFGAFAPVRFHDETQSATYTPLVNRPPLPAEVDGTPLTSLRDMDWSGDIDAGMLGEPDGPFLNKPDEGFISTIDPAIGGTGTQNPYYRSMNVDINGKRIRSWDPRKDGFFSPTRQMPSAIQFGSLPTGVLNNDPWRTLLFCPNSQAAMVPDSSGGLGHPGSISPHDYLYLDLFTMPTVEPYAISEPFSSAGKINLNQRLIPFSHIKRETGLHAVLKNLEMGATESDDITKSPWYKSATDPGTGASARWHRMRQLDVGRTIAEIGKVLDPGGNIGAGAFRSAAQICDVFLIPDDQGGLTPINYWKDRQLTADNSREAPYNYIYPLLTTQSNTFQIHYRIQTLTPLIKKTNFNPAEDFVVSGEMRGSYILERYLDINDPAFEGDPPPVNPINTPLNEYYKFRVLRHSAFTPGS